MMYQPGLKIKFDKKNVEDAYALTPLQEGLLFHYLETPVIRYQEQLCLDISGRIDWYLFKKAWHGVADNNEVLRTVFRWAQLGNPLQVVLKTNDLSILFYDYSHITCIDRETLINKLVNEDRNKKFNLNRAPFRIILCKTREDNYKIIFSYHHILLDGWSTGIILTEFFKNYYDLSQGREPAKPVKNRFKNYVKWIKNQDQHKSLQEKFWKEYLKGFAAPGTLSNKQTQDKRQENRDAEQVGRIQITLSNEIKDNLDSYRKNGKTTLAALLYSAWGILIQQYTSSRDIIFGTTTSGRTGKIEGIEHMVGLFINTIPLRIKTHPREKIQDLLLQTNKDLNAREHFEHTPLPEIKKYSDPGHGEELFDSIVVIENYPWPGTLIPGASGLVVQSYSLVETGNYDLTVIIPVFPGIDIYFVYDRQSFTEDTMIRLSGHFKRIIREIAGYPGKECRKIDILSEPEKQVLLEEFNNTAAIYPQYHREKTIHRLFARQVNRTPDRTALIGGQEENGDILHLTYAGLDRQSGQLAYILKAKGVRSEIVVGIMTERSVEMVIGIFGILKAGGVYLPVEPGNPQERINYMLTDSGTEFLVTVTAPGIQVKVQTQVEIGTNFITPGDISQPGSASTTPGTSPCPVSPASPAYIIYTSGSTGKPKGVMVEHASVVNVLLALHTLYPMNKTDAYLFKTPVVFDVSVTELFGWFLAGARLMVMEKQGEKNPGKLLNTIEQMGITHINFVPSMFNILVRGLNTQNLRQLSGLKYIFLAGEVLLPAAVTEFRRLNKTITLENIYGPTEGTVYSCKFPLSAWKGTGSIPIGRPLPNVRLYILDLHERLQPIGVPGELCIGGAGVARGYLNRPELTAGNFRHGFYRCYKSDKSFKSFRSYISKNIYRTGDLARWLADGNIEFLGRRDRQVKIRGFRIELGEIENQLIRHNRIKEAVVVPRGHEVYLCAYIIPKRRAAGISTGNPTNRELREYLSAKLPAYMIPSYFAIIEALPLTPSGKVDHQALPVPGIKTATVSPGPRNNTERKLADIWSEILPQDKGPGKITPGIDDNFFAWGGHSLNALTLILRIHKELNKQITLEQLFKQPTIRQLSALIDEAGVSVCQSPQPVEEREFYELTDNQKRLWIIHQLEPGSSAYNIAGKIALEPAPDINALKQAIYTMIERHQSLRTGFREVGGEPVQWVQKQFNLPMEIIDLSGQDQPAQSTSPGELRTGYTGFVFDLNRPPLFRSILVQLPAARYEIIFCMHHLISDGWSLEILKQEFFLLYEGYRHEKKAAKKMAVEPLHLHYKDYTTWQRIRLTDREYIENAQQFWRRIIGEGYGSMQLPRDYEFPQAGTGQQGAGYRMNIKKDLVDALEQVAQNNDTTLFVVMYSAFAILLSYLANQNEIFCGIPCAGREHVSLHRMVGFFLNTLVIKTTIHDREYFHDYLHRVSGDMMEALQYQGYPLEYVLGDLKKDFPYVPVFFNMLNMQDFQAEDTPGFPDSAHLPRVQDVKSDLNIYITGHTHGIAVSWHYRQKMFKPGTIEYMAGEYLNLLRAISLGPHLKITQYQVCSRENIKIKGNSIKPINEFTTFKKAAIHQSPVNRFEEQAALYPWNTAVKTPDGHFTYKELNTQANRAAHRILEINCRKSGAALLFEHDFLMIVGMLGALKAGTFYIPLDPENTEKRLIYMLKHANANILLTNNANLETAQQLIRACRHEIRLVNLSTLETGIPGDNLRIAIAPGDPAYVLYTSGSTGVPKGVVQNHRNVLHFIRVYTNQLHINTRDRLTLFSSYSFDAAVMDIYGALLNGAALYPLNIRQEENPGRLASWLQEEGITIFHSIPTIFRYFTDLLTRNREFPGIRLLVMGGEAVYQADVEKFKKYFSHNCLFINGLGPTESTVTLQYVIDNKVEISKNSVPVGFPVEETNIYLLKENDREARIYEKGEITFESDYLAVGYLNQQEKTGEAFTLNPLTNRKRIYRSGDLGIRLPDGAVEYRGRKDHQVKIRGYRVELGEIERTMETIEGIKTSVVVTRKTSKGENHLAAYYTVKDSPGSGKPGKINREIHEHHIRKILRELLPAYMIPGMFIQLADFPLTPGGKIDRQSLPSLEASHVLAPQSHEYGFTAPQGPIEEKIKEIWKYLLNLEAISTTANFFQLGGHSLSAALLAARIFKEFHVKIPLPEIFRSPSIKELSTYIQEAVKDRFTPIKACEKKEYYPLSSGQKRLYVLRQMAADSIGYNISNAFVLTGHLDLGKLEAVFCRLTRRHESFRTSFAAVDDELVQKVHNEVKFEIEYYDLETNEENYKLQNTNYKQCTCLKKRQVLNHKLQSSNKKEAGSLHSWENRILHHFIRPFDLSRAPLLRVGLIKTGSERYILVIDVHHITTDGLSLGIIARDLTTLYNGKTLTGLRLQYRDYSQWQNRRQKNEEIKTQEEFWMREFRGEIPVLNLPIDFKRPDIQHFEGSSLNFAINSQQTAKIKRLARERESTVFMVLFTIANVFLSGLTSQEDIIIGTPADGRTYPGLEDITGMFVNTLALRNYPANEKTFEELLTEVRQRILESYENQDYPFEHLVEHLGTHRDSGRNPLFDVMFTYRDFTGTETEIPGLTLTPYPYQNQISKFDLNLDAVAVREKLVFTLQYSKTLFQNNTIKRYTGYFKNIVSSILAYPGKRLGSIEILGKKGKNEILNRFNDTRVDYPQDRIVKVRFEEQVMKTPLKTAAVFADKPLNYLVLNEKANQLAHLFIKRGLGCQSLVPVLMDHSLELLIAFLSIMKVGAAFVPIDVRWPFERIKVILEDIKADILLVNPSTPQQGKDLDKETILIDRNNMPGHHHKKNPLPMITPESPVYVMYTSGSTGKPKGVMIPWRGITNRLSWMDDYFGIETAGVVLQTTRYVYDSVVWQFFWPLINGGMTIILPPDFVMSARPLAHLVEKYGITMVDFVPSVFKIIVDQLLEDPQFRGKLKSLREVILGAEEIIPISVYKFMEAFPGTRITNLYGPTEVSIGCIHHPVTGSEGDKIPIGRPIANIRVFILSPCMKLLPVGIAGEIFISGKGVGHGYLNDPGKTGDVFLENPFSPGKNMYRTGDLGKWTTEGRIDFLGRIDFQVKLRGIRIELAEIEKTLLAHTDIKDAVVIVREKQKDDKYLCAYIVPYDTLPNDLKSELANELPAYMIPTYFIPLDRIPLTPGGKLDRQALPEPEFVRSHREYLAPRDEIERKLVDIWSGVLGFGPPSDPIGIDANFFELGGNSLTAIAMIARIHKEFNVTVSLPRVFKTPNPAELADYIKTAAKNRYVSIKPVEAREYYEPSFNQERLWFLHQLEPGSPAFNMAARVELRQELDPDLLKKTLQHMIRRHESFRTGFRLINEEVVQYIVPRATLPFCFIDLSALEEHARMRKKEEIFIEEKAKPFDLSRAPIFRSILLKLHHRHYDLIFNMHHIISDGWSLDILETEFYLLYDEYIQGKDSALEPLKIQYKDFAAWQTKQSAEPVLREQAHRFWLKKLEEDVPVLELPRDFSRISRDNTTSDGEAYQTMVEEEITHRLKKLAEKNQTTLFMVMFSAYIILLTRLSDREDQGILCSIIAAGRDHMGLSPIVGFFVNSVPVKTRVKPEDTFADLLERVEKDTLPALQHQGYPLEPVCEELKIQYPRIPAAFNMLNLPMKPTEKKPDRDTGAITVPGRNIQGALFDLEPYVSEYKNSIQITWRYRDTVFKHETIKNIARGYLMLLEEISWTGEEQR